MEILKSVSVYKDWSTVNEDATMLDRLVVRTLLATNDVTSTLFITEASFEEVNRIYKTLEQVKSNHIERELMSVQLSNQDNQEDQNLHKEAEESNSKKRMDRKKAVGHVMSSIVKKNAGAKVVKVRYNTMEVKLADNRVVKVKVGLSKDYCDAEQNSNKICCSWHKEDDQEISHYDYHIYVVENEGSYKALIFNTMDLQNHLSKKSYNGHFANYYFHWHSDGSVTDERDTTTPIDVSKFDADKIQWSLY